ncbi:MAG TPA: TolC family protein [Steroidobacteraceae bacterium]|nr:TolC family protein [Steroidobacteraceae bacterium]
MSRPITARVAWLIGASLATFLARAESLDDAWAMALRQDAVLAATRNQAQAAELDAQAARGQRWPTIAVTGGYTRLDDSPAFDFAWTGLPIQPPPLFEDDAFVTGAATVTLPLFASGQISSSIAAAEAQARGANAQLQVATGDVKLAIAEAYVDVLRARKAHAVAQSSVRTLEAVASDTASLFERELVPKNELLAARVALADAKQNALRASNAAEVALAAYNRRIGAPMDRAVELDERIATTTDLPGTLETLIEQALARRSELSAFDARAEAYGQMARTERARVLPQVVLTAGYQYLENQFLDDDTVGLAGIGVRWALFDGGQSRKRAAALDHTRYATERLRDDARSLVQLQVRQAWLGLREARLRVDVTAGAAEQAEESLRIAQERYSAGLGTQTQLLEAQTLRARAQQNRDEAALDAELSELRLARAVGAL